MIAWCILATVFELAAGAVFGAAVAFLFAVFLIGWLR